MKDGFQLGDEDLDGDVSLHLVVASTIDLALASLADWLHDFVMSDYFERQRMPAM